MAMGSQASHASAVARRRAAARTGALLAVGALALSGCSLLGIGAPTDPDPDPTATETPRPGRLEPEGTTEVTVAPGEAVQVSLPDGSTGVGDMWGVVSVSDPAVAEADVEIGSGVFGQPPSSPNPTVGGSSPFSVEITGKAAGEAKIRVLYCTRTEVEEGCDQSQGTLDAPVEPVEITVRVE